MENIQPKKFSLRISDIDCTLVPDGSAFFIYVPGSIVGQKSKSVSVGVIENLRILECSYPEVTKLLSDIAEKIALN